MLKSHIPLSGKSYPYLATKDSYKSLSPMLCQWNYRDFVQVLAIKALKTKTRLAICSKQVLAGRRINFESLVFASEAILRQNTSDLAVSRPCLPFQPNNSEI